MHIIALLHSKKQLTNYPPPNCYILLRNYLYFMKLKLMFVLCNKYKVKIAHIDYCLCNFNALVN